MNNPRIIGSAPQLIVYDVVKTAEYYRDVLGFSILGYFGMPQVYAMVARDGFQVHFGKADGEQPITKNADIHKIGHDFILWVPEIDTFFSELKTNNAVIVQEIVTRVYGSREFVIEDCDGHRILIGD